MKKNYTSLLLAFLLLLTVSSNFLFAQSVTVGAAATSVPAVVSGAGTIKTYTPTAGNTDILATDIVADLAVFTTVIINSGTANTDNIFIANAITFGGAAGKTLKFAAKNKIEVNAAISSTMNALNLEFVGEGLGNNDRAIFIQAALTTAGGNINIDGKNNADFAAVAINNTVAINSGSGNITIKGVAASVAGTFPRGVLINGTATTLTATGAGKIDITGNSAGAVPAVDIKGAILTAAGNITVKGTNTNTNIVSTFARGVFTDTNGTLTTTTGKIDITGETSADASAVEITQAISSAGGDIILKGTNTNTVGGSTKGVSIVAAVATTGTGKIDINGTSAGQNAAVEIQNPIQTANGNIILTGKNTSILLGIGQQYGVRIVTGTLTATGAGNIDINGETASDVQAVEIRTAISSAGGNITIKGKSTKGRGVYTLTAGTLTTTGTGKIDITGETAGDIAAVEISQPIGNNTTMAGDIILKGTNTNTTGANARGVFIAVTLTTTGTGKIDITGDNQGDVAAIEITQAIQTGNGNITIKGTATNTGNNARGVLTIGTITTTGAGKIDITGNNKGDLDAVIITQIIQSAGGDITIKGTATNIGTSARGVRTAGGGNLTTTGAGKIDIIGENAGNIPAVEITRPIQTDNGNITIRGTANATTGTSARGVSIAAAVATTAQGNIDIIGDSKASLNTGVIVTTNIQTNKGISIKSNNSGITVFGYLASANGGDITLCVPNGSGISVTAANAGVSVGTTGGAAIKISQGLLPFTVGSAAFSGTAGSVSNVVNTIPTVTTQNTSTPLTAGTISISIVGITASPVNALTEANLNGAFVTLNLESCINVFATALTAANFSLTNFPAGTSIASVTRISDTQVNITLAYNDTDFDVNVTTARVNALSTALNPASPSTLTSGNLTITATVEPPTDMTLSGNTIAEKQAANTVVGNLTATGARTTGSVYTYSLVAGTGSTDNGSFNIVGNNLRSGAVFNFLAKNSYTIRVRATDNINGTTNFEKQFTITILNTNTAPTNLALSANTIAENSPANTEIGTLTTTDADAGDTFTYSLAPNGLDNDAFTIVGDRLRSNAPFDFETKNSYSIRVRTTDQGGLGFSFERTLTIIVTNVNEAPTNITLSPDAIQENKPANSEVGTFSTTDPDGVNSTFTYAFAPNGADNDAFTIVGDKLRIKAPFDFEKKNSYSIRVRTTDQGDLSVEKNITINVIDVLETPNAPQTVNVKAGNGQITLSWSENPNAVRYEIYMYSANSPQQLVGSTTQNTFTVIGLQNMVNYFFRIVAFGTDGSNSDFTAPVSARPSVVLGVEEETANSLFQVYPNPSNGNLTLKANELKGKNATISILDMSGRVVFSQALQTNGSVETELNLNLSSGVYLLSISTEKDNLKRKLVVQK